MHIGTKAKKKILSLRENILVQKAIKGDRGAYGKLYKIYVDPIYRYIYFRIGEDEETAQDLTQETFMKAWENMNRFKTQKGTFKAWVYTIARNITIDYFRVNNKSIRITESFIDEKQDLEKEIILKDEVNGMFTAIKKLPTNQKEILILSYVNELSNREISKILNKNSDTLRSLKYRALKNLKKEINHE